MPVDRFKSVQVVNVVARQQFMQRKISLMPTKLTPSSLWMHQNAFNALNRAAALHNVRISCPTIATYAINTYRLPARLFILGGKELTSAEGTTQGDPLAMSLYAISVQPLISILQNSSETRQCWFADDATGSGSLEDIKK